MLKTDFRPQKAIKSVLHTFRRAEAVKSRAVCFLLFFFLRGCGVGKRGACLRCLPMHLWGLNELKNRMEWRCRRASGSEAMKIILENCAKRKETLTATGGGGWWSRSGRSGRGRLQQLHTNAPCVCVEWQRQRKKLI